MDEYEALLFVLAGRADQGVVLEARHEHRLVRNGLRQTHLGSTYHATHHAGSCGLSHDRAEMIFGSQTASQNMVNGEGRHQPATCRWPYWRAKTMKGAVPEN